MKVWGESRLEQKQEAAEEGAGDQVIGMGMVAWVGCNGGNGKTMHWIVNLM